MYIVTMKRPYQREGVFNPKTLLFEEMDNYESCLMSKAEAEERKKLLDRLFAEETCHVKIRRVR